VFVRRCACDGLFAATYAVAESARAAHMREVEGRRSGTGMPAEVRSARCRAARCLPPAYGGICNAASKQAIRWRRFAPRSRYSYATAAPRPPMLPAARRDKRAERAQREEVCPVLPSRDMRAVRRAALMPMPRLRHARQFYACRRHARFFLLASRERVTRGVCVTVSPRSGEARLRAHAR